MKKKIVTSVIITVIFALVISTISLVVLFNYKILSSTKESLKGYAKYISSLEGIEKGKLVDYKINGSSVRCTIIDEKGKVIYDSIEQDFGSHDDREEVIIAKEQKEGFSIRNSETTGKRMVYYAVKLENGQIIRASLPYETIELLDSTNFKVCIAIVIIVLIFSISLSLKLVRAIVEPIKNLQNVTSRISKGDLNIRVKNMPNDEIGSLGVTFNTMANQLQSKMKEVYDKQNRLESILNSVESGVIALNLKNEIISINPYAKRIFNIKGEVEEKNISDFIKDYDVVNFLNEDGDLEKEIKIINPMERDLRVRKSSIIQGNQIVGKVIAILDISDIKRLENMRSQFVANVSHELKTPLTSIRGFSETLKGVSEEETRLKFLGIIEKEAERLSRLINDILVLSKIESNVNGKEEEFLPNGVIEEVISMLSPQASEKKIIMEYEEHNNNYLVGDRDRFLQLVLNLVENSIKYNRVEGNITIKSSSNNGEYILEVIDSGIGIKKEDINRIFERFYQVDKARKTGGTGLGLAIVKYIVKSFNGEVKVSSVIDKGTEVIVRIKHL